jgi:hypothetical protein
MAARVQRACRRRRRRSPWCGCGDRRRPPWRAWNRRPWLSPFRPCRAVPPPGGGCAILWEEMASVASSKVDVCRGFILVYAQIRWGVRSVHREGTMFRVILILKGFLFFCFLITGFTDFYALFGPTHPPTTPGLHLCPLTTLFCFHLWSTFVERAAFGTLDGADRTRRSARGNRGHRR